MTKTLADMTADEREACVGMWASHQGHEDKNEPCGNLGVISEIDREYAWVAFPKEHAETYVFDLEDLAPRFDLPRAWTPDGEPLEKTDTRGLVYRLQSAVREMLYELNLYQQQENDRRVRKEALDTIETFGLKKEDME